MKETIYFVLAMLPFIPAFVVLRHTTDLPREQPKREEFPSVE